MRVKPYRYHDMMRDAPKQIYNEGRPDEPGWYVCKSSQAGTYHLRWYESGRFSIWCNQLHAIQKRLDRDARCRTTHKVYGWTKPWWPTPHLGNLLASIAQAEPQAMLQACSKQCRKQCLELEAA